MLAARKASEEEIEESGLSHRVYLPEGAGEGGRRHPLVLMVHGRAGNESVMWVFSKALESTKPIVVAPQAPIADPIGGFSWWLMAHDPDSESPAPSSTAMEDLRIPLEQLEQFIACLPQLYPVDLSEVYGFGFSQGGALLSSLSLRHPLMFRGVAVLSSFVPGVILKENSARFFEALPDYYISHGTKDTVIPLERAQAAKEFLESKGAEVEYHTDDVGHKISTSGIRGLRTWIEQRLNSAPTL